MFGRSPFKDVVESQLDLFAREHAELLAHAQELLARYDRTGRDEAEEAFGDYADANGAAAEALEEMRDHYARTLEDPDGYVRAFDKAVRRRWPALGQDLD
jgi:hypothetical protein